MHIYQNDFMVSKLTHALAKLARKFARLTNCSSHLPYIFMKM